MARLPTPLRKLIEKLGFVEDLHIREVISGTATALALKVVGGGFQFLLTVLLARILGAEGAGVYYLAFALTSITVIVARMGLDIGVLRFIAASASESNWNAVKGATRKTLSIVGLLSVLLALLVFLAAPSIANLLFGKPEVTQPLRWMSVAIVPFAMMGLFAEMLKGLKRILSSVILPWVLVPGFTCLGLAVFAPVWGISGAAVAFMLASWTTAIIGWWLWRRATPHLASAASSFDIMRLIRVVPPLLALAVLGLLMQWTGTFFLGIFESSKDVGVFTVALRTALLVSFVLPAANSILAPKFAELYQLKNLNALCFLARTTSLMMAVLVSPVAVVLVGFPGLVMGIFGSEFEQGANLLVILSLGQLVNAVTGAVGFLLIMTGHETDGMKISLAAVCLNIILNVALIPMFGAIGAAWATSISLAASNFLSVFVIRRRLGFWPVVTFSYIWERRHTN